MMQGLVLDKREPLYGRAAEIMNLRPIGFDWMKTVFPALSPRGRLEHYAVWGGVPRYWELSEHENSLWQTVRQQVFSPLGLLRNEPAHLLLDDLKDSVQASSFQTILTKVTWKTPTISPTIRQGPPWVSTGQKAIKPIPNSAEVRRRAACQKSNVTVHFSGRIGKTYCASGRGPHEAPPRPS